MMLISLEKKCLQTVPDMENEMELSLAHSLHSEKLEMYHISHVTLLGTT